jgi:hypothetical protein
VFTTERTVVKAAEVCLNCGNPIESFIHGRRVHVDKVHWGLPSLSFAYLFTMVRTFVTNAVCELRSYTDCT